MEGASGAHRIRFSDGNDYIVKFQKGNPGNKTLVNELVSHRIATLLEAPVPPCTIVNVSQEFIDATPQLKQDGVKPGLQFGSRFIQNSTNVSAHLNAQGVENLRSMFAVEVLDTLLHCTDRSDGHNLLAAKQNGEAKANLFVFDFSHVFGTPEWTPQNLAQLEANVQRVAPPLQNLQPDLVELERAVARLEELTDERLEAILQEVPKEWGLTETDRHALKRCIQQRVAKLPGVFFPGGGQGPRGKHE